MNEQHLNPAMADLTNITNFIQLTADIGTAGQPQPHQFADIAAAGYATVVNLAMHDSDNAVPDEGKLVSAQGMSYIHLPIDFAAPTADDARLFIKLMQALAPRKVFVHCALNLRVSAFMYLYLRHARGLEDAAARSPLIAKWEPRMDQVWKDFLRLSPAAVGISSPPQ